MGVRVQFDEEEEDEGSGVVYEIKEDQEEDGDDELGVEADYDETLKRTVLDEVNCCLFLFFLV